MFFVFYRQLFYKGNAMNRYIQLIPLGAVLALAVASASAQNTAPAATTGTPAAVGVTPQAAAEANQQAVPRSDTGTLVQTSPSSADKARAALEGSSTGNTATGAASSQSAAPMNGGSGNSPMTSTRRARADRN